MSGDATWEPVTGTRPQEKWGFEWVECLDYEIFASLHEGFRKLVSDEVPFDHPVHIVNGDGARREARLMGQIVNGVEPFPRVLYFTLTLLSPREPTAASVSPAPSARPIASVPEFVEHEEDTLAPLNQRATKAAITFVGAAAVLACFVMMVVPWFLSSQTSHAGTGNTPRQGQSLADAKSVLRQFHAANSIEERSKLVLNGSAVLPLMQRFYRDRPHKTNAIASVQNWDILTLDQRPHYVARGFDIREQPFLSMVDLSGDRPQVNWEASVGYGEMRYEDFVVWRPTNKVLMRLLISPIQYYNFSYDDSQTYASFLVRANEDGRFLYGYAKRNSSGFTKLKELFPAGARQVGGPLRLLTAAERDHATEPPRRVTLALRFTHTGRETDQVAILDVLGEDWVHVPAANASAAPGP